MFRCSANQKLDLLKDFIQPEGFSVIPICQRFLDLLFENAKRRVPMHRNNPVCFLHINPPSNLPLCMSNRFLKKTNQGR